MNHKKLLVTGCLLIFLFGAFTFSEKTYYYDFLVSENYIWILKSENRVSIYSKNPKPKKLGKLNETHKVRNFALVEKDSILWLTPENELWTFNVKDKPQRIKKLNFEAVKVFSTTYGAFVLQKDGFYGHGVAVPQF